MGTQISKGYGGYEVRDDTTSVVVQAGIATLEEAKLVSEQYLSDQPEEDSEVEVVEESTSEDSGEQEG